VLVLRVILEVLLDVIAPRPHRVPSIDDAADDVAGIEHLVQLLPDPLRLPSLMPLVPCHDPLIQQVILPEIVVTFGRVAPELVLGLAEEIGVGVGVQLRALALLVLAEDVRVAFDVEEVGALLLQRVLEKGDRELLLGDEDLERILGRFS